MRTWKHTTLAFVAPAALLAMAAVPARAEATIDGPIAVTFKKGTKFVVQADVTMSDKGEVVLAGVVGETPYELRKRFKTRSGRSKTKTMKFLVDPAKLGIRDAVGAIFLQAQMTAAENGQAEPAIALGGGALPPPHAVVPGTGNELARGSYQPFVDAMNDAAGGPCVPKGRRATAAVFHYNSLSIDADQRSSLERFGDFIAKKAGKMDKKSKLFARIDIIGHSLGGVIIRQAMVPADNTAKAAPSLAGTVRHAFFLGAPQSGTPIAYLAESAIVAAQAIGADPKDLAGGLLGQVDNPSAGGLADLLLNENFIGIVRVFIPTYPFADVPFGPGVARVGVDVLSQGTATPRLNELNSVPPDPDTTYHAIHYSSVAGATGEIQRVSAVDLVGFLSGGGTNLGLISMIDGPGDGVCPQDSTLMDFHPAWTAVLRPIDLGPGSHSPTAPSPAPGNGYLADPNCIGYILSEIFALDL